MPEDAADVVDPRLKAVHLVVDPHVVGLATERTSLRGRAGSRSRDSSKSPVLYLSKHVEGIEKVSEFILFASDITRQ